MNKDKDRKTQRQKDLKTKKGEKKERWEHCGARGVGGLVITTFDLLF